MSSSVQETSSIGNYVISTKFPVHCCPSRVGAKNRVASQYTYFIVHFMSYTFAFQLNVSVEWVSQDCTLKFHYA